MHVAHCKLRFLATCLKVAPYHSVTTQISFNVFRVFDLKCQILKQAFQASFNLVALLYAHYNVLFEVPRNCLSLRQNIKRKYLNDILQYNRSPAVLFA